VQTDVNASAADVTFSASVTSKKGSVSLAANGNLSLSGGTISAGGGITLTGGSPLTLGAPLAAGADITISGAEAAEIDAPVTSTGGNVTISNGQVVTVSAPITAQTGNIDISAGNEVITSSPISAGGSATLAAASVLSIDAPVSAGAGQEIIASAPLVVVGGTLTVPGNAGTPQAAGPVNVLVEADNLTVTSPINAPGGIVAFTPYTQGNPLTVDNTQPTSPGPVLTTSELGLVDTSGGGLNGSLYLGGTGPGQGPLAGTVTINSALTLPSGQSLGLFSADNVVIGAAINLSGPAALTGLAGADLSTSAPITTAGSIELRAGIIFPGQPPSGSGGFLLGGAVTTTDGSVSLSGCCVTLAGAPVTATGTISLGAASFGGITTGAGSTLQAGAGLFVIGGGPIYLGNAASTSGGPILIQGTEVTIAAPVTSSAAGQPLTIQASDSVTASASIAMQGNIDLEANSAAAGTPSGHGALTLEAPVTTTAGSVSLSGASVQIGSLNNQVTIEAPINATGSISVTATTLDVEQWNGSPLKAGGDISISAADFITLYDMVTSTNGSVTINAGTDVLIGYPGNNPPPASVTASGTLVVNAGAGGITQLTVAPLTAGGNIVLYSSDVVNLNAPIVSNTGAVSITGLNVADAAPITAATSIAVTATGPDSLEGPTLQLSNGSLTAGGSIQINATAPGSVFLGDAVSSSGGPVSIGGSTVTVNAPIYADTTVGIDATASLTTGETGTISSGGNIDLASTGTVTIAPPIISAGNVSVTSGIAVTITDPIFAGAGFEILVAAPLVDIYSRLVVPNNPGAPQVGGPVNVLVQANTFDIGAEPSNPKFRGTIIAVGGIVAITPYTQGFPLTVDNSGLVSPGPVLTTGELGLVQTNSGGVVGSLYLGGVGGRAPAVAGSVTFDDTTTLGSAGPIASTLGLFATGPVTEQPGVVVTADTLLGAAGSLTMNNANAIGNLASFTTSTGFSLSDAVPLAIIGPVTDPTSISLSDTGGAVTEALGGGGSLTTGLLTGSSTSSVQLVNTNAVRTLGSFTASGGFTLVNTGPLTVSGPVTGGPSVDITDTGAVTLTGLVTANVVGLTASGSALTETGAGVISGGTLFGAAASATLNGANTVGTLAAFTTTGGFTLVNTGPLIVPGPVTGGPLVDITDAGPVSLAGPITATVVGLTATGSALSETGAGLISTGTLFGSAASATLTNANTVGVLGPFTTTGGFTLVSTGPLTVSGPVTGGSLVDITDAGALSVTGPITATVVGLTATGSALSETDAGLISAGTLFGGAASATLGNANTVGVLDTFTTTSGFLLDDTGGLIVAGDVSAPSGTVTLNTDGALTETTGRIDALALTGSATSAQLNNANTIGTLGSFSAPDGLALEDVRAVLVTGPVDPNSIAIFDTQSITLAGNVNASTVSLIAQNGSIVQTAGVLTAGALSGSAATGAQFGGVSPGVALVGTLGSFTVGNGAFVLADSEALTVAGPLTAPYFQVVAPGQITLANATITTTGLPLAAQSGVTPAAPGSNFQVIPVGGAGSFVQTGVATIQGLDGTQATVRIDVPAAGNILLADLSAPNADIILASPGGSLLGNLFANNLLVIGMLGSSNLSGSIRGVTTPGAAALGQIEPAINTAYLFNGCVIASATCGGAPGHVGDLPPTATLLLPTLSIEDLNTVLSDTDPATLQPNGRARQNVQLYITFPPTLPGDSNPDIVLPNVSGHDY